MNTITIKGKSYKLYEGKRGGKYIMKGGKKFYQTNLEMLKGGGKMQKVGEGCCKYKDSNKNI